LGAIGVPPVLVQSRQRRPEPEGATLRVVVALIRATTTLVSKIAFVHALRATPADSEISIA
jgi:hypothetical protein